MGKKLRIGWFSFSCCEDSTIVFTELLNDYYKVWKEKVDFVSALVLKKKSEIKDLDVAFVEGAITSDTQEKKLLEIRNNSKKLVAIGSCACTGMPSSQRNDFDDLRKKEIDALLKQFHMSEKVRKISELVKVDTQVPGCPMSEELFLKVLNMYLKEFGVIE